MQESNFSLSILVLHLLLSFIIKPNLNIVMVLIIFLKMFTSRYILEGKELEFYMKKLQRKKGKGAAGAAA